MAFLRHPDCLAEYRKALALVGEALSDSKAQRTHARTRSEAQGSPPEPHGPLLASNPRLATIGCESEQLAEEPSSSEQVLQSNEANCLLKSAERNAEDKSLASVGSQKHCIQSTHSGKHDFARKSLADLVQATRANNHLRRALAQRSDVARGGRAKAEVAVTRLGSKARKRREELAEGPEGRDSRHQGGADVSDNKGQSLQSEEEEQGQGGRVEQGVVGRVEQGVVGKEKQGVAEKEKQGVVGKEKQGLKESPDSTEQNEKSVFGKDGSGEKLCLCRLESTGRLSRDCLNDQPLMGVRSVLKRPTFFMEESLLASLLGKKETLTFEANLLSPKQPQKQQNMSAQIERESSNESPGVLSRCSGNELKGASPNSHLVVLPERQPEPVTLSAKEVLELNPEINSRTVTHVWQKFVTPSSWTTHDLAEPPNRLLRMTSSVFAHLDAIRRIEWVPSDSGLTLLTFSHDCLVKQWRVQADSDLESSGLAKTGSLASKLTVEANSLAPGLQQPLDSTGSLPTSTTQPREPSSRQSKCPDPWPSGKAVPKGARVGLKQAAALRLHSAPIFSSFACQQSDGSVRCFSGDSKGWVFCSVLAEEGLRGSRCFSTGPEPCWALSLLQRNTLVASTPLKVKVHRLTDQNCGKEVLAFANKNGHFGQLRRQTDASVLVHTFARQGPDSHFASFDLQRQREAFRLPSPQGFSNSFVFVPQLGSLYSANQNRTVSVHDLRMASLADFFFAHSDPVTCLDVSYDQQLMVTAGSDSSVRLWDLRNLKILDEVKAHRRKDDDSIFEIRFDPSSKLVASCGADGALKIFHL